MEICMYNFPSQIAELKINLIVFSSLDTRYYEVNVGRYMGVDYEHGKQVQKFIGHEGKLVTCKNKIQFIFLYAIFFVYITKLS